MLDILEEIAQEKNGITVSEIAKRLNLQISTTYNLLNTLKMRDYVYQDIETKKYFIGVKIMSLKNTYTNNLDIQKVAAPYLDELHKEIAETIHLSIRVGSHVVPVHRLEAKHAIRVDSEYVGNKGPLYCTATGRALLLSLPESELDCFLNRIDILPFTEHTITDIEKIKEELANSKARGYTRDFMEYQQGVFCIGAPIYNYNSDVISSISVSVPSLRFSPHEQERITNNVIKTAQKISQQLGYQQESV